MNTTLNMINFWWSINHVVGVHIIFTKFWCFLLVHWTTHGEISWYILCSVNHALASNKSPCSAWGANQMQLHLVYWSAVIIISTKGLFPPPGLAHLQLVSCAWTHLLHIFGACRCDCATLAQFVQCYVIVALTYDAVVDHSLRSLLDVTKYTSHALCTDSASSQQDYNQVSFISNWARTRCCIHCSAWNLQRQCT